MTGRSGPRVPNLTQHACYLRLHLAGRWAWHGFRRRAAVSDLFQQFASARIGPWLRQPGRNRIGPRPRRSPWARSTAPGALAVPRSAKASVLDPVGSRPWPRAPDGRWKTERGFGRALFSSRTSSPDEALMTANQQAAFLECVIIRGVGGRDGLEELCCSNGSDPGLSCFVCRATGSA